MSPMMMLLATYYMCDGAAAANALTRQQFMACQMTYETVKVAFVEGVEPEDVPGLSAPERAAVMREGYRRLKAWEHENAGLAHGFRENHALLWQSAADQ